MSQVDGPLWEDTWLYLTGDDALNEMMRKANSLGEQRWEMGLNFAVDQAKPFTAVCFFNGCGIPGAMPNLPQPLLALSPKKTTRIPTARVPRPGAGVVLESAGARLPPTPRRVHLDARKFRGRRPRYLVAGLRWWRRVCAQLYLSRPPRRR